MVFLFGQVGQRLERARAQREKHAGGMFWCPCACGGPAGPPASLVARSKKHHPSRVVFFSACQKRLAEFAARRRQKIEIIFHRDMCVGKIPLRLQVWNFAAYGKIMRAAGCKPFVGKTRRVFRQPKKSGCNGFPLHPLSVAAGEGFEPSHTESESAVLPLHNPAMSRRTKTIIQVLRCLSTVFFFGAFFSAGPMGGGQAARRSAEVKYFFSGLYSRANTTTHRMMLGSI